MWISSSLKPASAFHQESKGAIQVQLLLPAAERPWMRGRTKDETGMRRARIATVYLSEVEGEPDSRLGLEWHFHKAVWK